MQKAILTMLVCLVAFTGCTTLETLRDIPSAIRLNNPLNVDGDLKPTTRALITQAMRTVHPNATDAELDAIVTDWFKENAGDVSNIHKLAEREANRIDAINTFVGMISVMLNK